MSVRIKRPWLKKIAKNDLRFEDSRACFRACLVPIKLKRQYGRRLPPKVLRNIIEQLVSSIPYPRDTLRNLYNLCLTNRALYVESRRVLYRSVVLQWKVARQILAVVNKRAAQCVQYLNVPFYNADFFERRKSYCNGPYPPLPLRKMTSLRTLIISGGYFSTGDFEHWKDSLPKDILTTSKARALLTTHMFDLLKRQHNIRNLAIQGIDNSFDVISSRSLTVLPHLKDLEVYDPTDWSFLILFLDRSIRILRLETLHLFQCRVPDHLLLFTASLTVLNLSSIARRDISDRQYSTQTRGIVSFAPNLRMIASYGIIIPDS